MNHKTVFKKKLIKLFRTPERISIFGFLALILSGTLLLMLPVASNFRHMNFIDALFTATSACCVTGLVVVDTGTFFTHFGRVVIVTLIQIGGLGIMTLSTLFLLTVGKRPALGSHIVIKDTFTYDSKQNAYLIAKKIFLFTLIFESAGTLVLFLRFVPDMGYATAFYYSVFHSVSAFCNAGFSLFKDSFMQYKEDWILNATVCMLVISGGIGFIVISDLFQTISARKKRWTHLSLHSRLAISATAILMITGTLAILIMEWNNTLKPFSLHGRFIAAFFQSVTSRTAGFNTLPVGNLANETLCLIMVLMFIGACPGSCGGGTKTTTMASLVALGVSRFRGKERPEVFKRTIPDSCIGKAVSVIMISMLLVTLATMAILISEIGEIPHPESRGRFLELFFEVISAFGTVGLSTGITATLSQTGKIIITIVMFAGRLGPLLIALAVSREKMYNIRYAEENIMIG